ncbi:hypothetical protein HCX58_14045 [Listeria welshimeri]|nr:hypothetical protein [Listeria welshimeri]MBC1350751.1 hypothetical protein [Listeria welshimeri]MBC1705819.1 hypothetical protein [Listeria welshimeri]
MTDSTNIIINTDFNTEDTNYEYEEKTLLTSNNLKNLQNLNVQLFEQVISVLQSNHNQIKRYTKNNILMSDSQLNDLIESMNNLWGDALEVANKCNYTINSISPENTMNNNSNEKKELTKLLIDTSTTLRNMSNLIDSEVNKLNISKNASSYGVSFIDKKEILSSIQINK